MKTKDLDAKLNEWLKKLPTGDRQTLLAHLFGLKSVYPFNEYEHRLMHLLDKKVISIDDYELLRESYTSTNKYLHLYGLSPRVFGGIWAEQHLKELDQQFQKPTKVVDKKYSGEYDLFIKDNSRIIKVEVKASRAINTKIRGNLETKALGLKSQDEFWMNFQQLKFGVADIFVFIGVWVDTILYWVLTTKEAKKHHLLSHQHRGGVEYQIGITNKNINEFKKFLVEPSKLVDKIVSKLRG